MSRCRWALAPMEPSAKQWLFSMMSTMELKTPAFKHVRVSLISRSEKEDARISRSSLL
jgi:hypothetical protein